tara:strand:- start:15223 stop:15477 length:255 start_codon:yes stop_codon:yes gene_type:complete
MVEYTLAVVNGVETEVPINTTDFPYGDPFEDMARGERDNLLQSTDVWALSDRTMTAEQTAYRQALRDITDQAGFPTEITWPTKP